MDISAVIAQVKAFAPFFAGNVAGGANLSAVLDKAPTTLTGLPWAYVVPLGSEPGPNQSQNGLDQLLTERIGVVAVFDNAVSAADRRGQGAATLAYSNARQDIWSALLNWSPEAEFQTQRFRYDGDDLVQQDIGRAVYEFRFSREVLLTEVDGWQEATEPLTEIDLSLIPLDGSPNHVTGVAGAGGVTAYQVLMPDGSGGLIPADPSSPAFAFAGIATAPSAAGEPVCAIRVGGVCNPAWAWPEGAQPLYAGPNGSLLTAPPPTGVAQLIAVTSGSTSIYVTEYQPVTGSITLPTG